MEVDPGGGSGLTSMEFTGAAGKRRRLLEMLLAKVIAMVTMVMVAVMLKMAVVMPRAVVKVAAMVWLRPGW